MERLKSSPASREKSQIDLPNLQHWAVLLLSPRCRGTGCSRSLPGGSKGVTSPWAAIPDSSHSRVQTLGMGLSEQEIIGLARPSEFRG